MNKIFGLRLPNNIDWCLKRKTNEDGRQEYFFIAKRNKEIFYNIKSDTILKLKNRFRIFWKKEKENNGWSVLEENESENILEKRMDQELSVKMLNNILNDLTPREQKVLRMRFGLEDGIPHTLEQVGEVFGVTRERIRQIEKKSLKKLKLHPLSKILKNLI